MIDFGIITGFDWDQANASKITQKHNVLPSEAEQVFMNQPLVLLEDENHSQQERRWGALGYTAAGRLLFVSFTLPRANTFVRVISARDMTRKERETYEHQT